MLISPSLSPVSLRPQSSSIERPLHNCTSRRFVILSPLIRTPLILRRAQHERPHPPLSISLSSVSLRPQPSSIRDLCKTAHHDVLSFLSPLVHPPGSYFDGLSTSGPTLPYRSHSPQRVFDPNSSSIERPLHNCTSRRFVISLTLDPHPAHTSTGSARAAPPSLIDKEGKYTSRGLW